MIEVEPMTRWENLTDKIGRKLIEPLYKIKDISEASSPYLLIVLTVLLLCVPMISYLVVFRDQGFMNFAFMQAFACMMISYGLCRQLTILPYLTDPDQQFELKVSAVLIQVCLICFV